MFRFAIALCILAGGTQMMFGQLTTCTNATLTGNYAGSGSGTRNGATVTTQAIATFDGSGNISYTGFTAVENGVLLVQDAAITGGTYTVNPNCSGTMSITVFGNTLTYHFLLAGPSFTELQVVETDSGTSLVAVAHKQLPPG
jgi:hypothetical protein